jgi:hypothetical protein
MKKLSIKDELTEFLLYSTPEGNIKVEVILNEETVWLSQRSIAQLFGVQVPAISKHLKNILTQVNLMKNQLFPFWKQLHLTVKNTKLDISILMQ